MFFVTLYHLHILKFGKAHVNEDEQRSNRQQQHTQRRAQRPVSDGAELVFDDVADVEHLTAAQHIGHGVNAQRRDKGKDDGRENTREGQREGHP